MRTSEDDVAAFSTMIRERKIDSRTYVRVPSPALIFDTRK